MSADTGSFYALLTIDPQAALRDVMARRELHRNIRHGGGAEDFHDCVTCGVLDRQLRRAEEATK